MKRLKQLIIGCALMLGIGGVMLPVASVSAVNVFDQCQGNSSPVCKAQNDDDATAMIKIVINTLLIVLGMISVIMIVIGGIRYTTSNGDPSGIKTAKDTVLYSVIGLVVAILSYAIVNFVVGAF